MTADEFPRLFAAAFGAQDAAALAAMLAEDAQVVTLTGALAEGRVEAQALFAAEFAGIFSRARLVTGRLSLRPIGPGAAVLHQRYVVTGAQDAGGEELPRFAALLGLVLLAKAEGWQALSLTFSALVEQ
jgi:uncharacterized protein (TIGR02246 family)